MMTSMGATDLSLLARAVLEDRRGAVVIVMPGEVAAARRLVALGLAARAGAGMVAATAKASRVVEKVCVEISAESVDVGM